MDYKNEVDDKSLEDVAGGIDNFFVKLGGDKKYDIKHDDKWKRTVKDAAKRFDSQSVHLCVCGSCIGCGSMVGTDGDVCEECRREAKCLK